MLYQGIIGGGSSPVEDLSPVLLWTNPSPTSAFSPQKIELDLTNYAGVIVEYRYSNEYDFMCTRTFVKKDDVMTYTVSNGNAAEYGSGCGYKVSDSDSWASRGRTITSIDNTGITFGKGGYANSADANNIIPTKIYGVQKYVVEPVSGIQFSEFATMTANTDIDAVIGDYYILESRDTYNASASSSTIITGADKIIEKLDNLTTQKVAIYTTVIKATSNKFRCDKPGYYSHITLN